MADELEEMGPMSDEQQLYSPAELASELGVPMYTLDAALFGSVINAQPLPKVLTAEQVAAVRQWVAEEAAEDAAREAAIEAGAGIPGRVDDVEDQADDAGGFDPNQWPFKGGLPEIDLPPIPGKLRVMDMDTGEAHYEDAEPDPVVPPRAPMADRLRGMADQLEAMRGDVVRAALPTAAADQARRSP